jgi:hypothetical protein
VIIVVRQQLLKPKHHLQASDVQILEALNHNVIDVPEGCGDLVVTQKMELEGTQFLD